METHIEMWCQQPYLDRLLPGTKVFCGDPLMYVTPSMIEATAKSVDGEISESPFLMLFKRFSAVSFKPSLTSANLSVLAVHRTITQSQIKHTHYTETVNPRQ